MSIPKEPRQLMINLMYLVLTAMLALNVSAKIINAFFSIEKGIAGSNKITTDANAILESGLNKAVQEQAKYKPLQEAAEKVSAMVKEYQSYVEEIRESLKDGKGMFPDDDKHHAGMPLTYKNKDVTTRILVVEGKGKELKEKIEGLRAEIMNTMYELADKKVEGTVFKTAGREAPELKELEGRLTLKIDDESWKEHGAPSWEHFNFNQLPVAALWPMLTKFQADAKSSEAAVLNFLVGQIGATSFKVDAFIPIASPEKAYLLQGQTFKATVGVGASSKSFFEGVSISVNGRSLPVKDGEAEYTETASGLGEKTYSVSISVKNPATGEVLRAEKKYKYEVGQASAAVALDKMNVIYIGVDNPVTVSASGYSSNAISVVGSGGINLRKVDGSHYIATGSAPSQEASISINAEGKTVASQKIRIKRIPDPIAKLGGVSRGGQMGSGEFKAQQGVAAMLDNFDFEAKCEIVGFGMFRIPKRADPVPAKNSGARFSGTAADLVKAATPGDAYYFEDIKAKCPGDSAGRDIGTMSFTIR